MSIIRGAAKDNSVDKWYTYDQQLRLRVSKDDTKKWLSIDGFLWLRIMTINTPKTNNNYGYKCYDFNFKGLCKRNNCLYRHVCLKCNFPHPAINCTENLEITNLVHSSMIDYLHLLNKDGGGHIMQIYQLGRSH